MNFKFLLAGIAFLAILSAGCIADNFDSGYAKIKEMNARYNLGEQLAPTSLEQITAYKSELNALKQATTDSALSSFIDFKANVVETMESLGQAELEMQLVNPARIDCREDSPISRAIVFLEKAFQKSDQAKKRIDAFKSAYPQISEKYPEMGSGETRISELNKSIKAQLDYEKTVKLESCR